MTKGNRNEAKLQTQSPHTKQAKQGHKDKKNMIFFFPSEKNKAERT